MDLGGFYKTRDWTPDAHDDMRRRDVGLPDSTPRSSSWNRSSPTCVSSFLHTGAPRGTRARQTPDTAGAPISTGFSTGMSGPVSQPCFRSPRVKVWAFGHTPL
ncbi:hypothetical protein F4775DRAFT_546771 [Biscogniauxia sp. FL1348]|nr:hypothetical protein F4775DRAFT_546771 [Biscogniauxia sp. FL1348]